MPVQTVLPPLPRSDTDALSHHTFNQFYKRSSAGFWEGNQVIQIEVTPDVKCDHEFEHKGTETICKKCRFGLIGPQLEVRQGKLFHLGEPLGL